MAKSQKRRPRQKGIIMGRSDIPFAQRMAMQHRSNIVVNREHAAKIAMFCMSVALHEIAGIGYKRLVKFSLRFKDMIDEFYEDVELGMAHAHRRMEQIGMPISGEFYSVEVVGLSKKDQQIHDHALQASQIALICGAIAMNDEFGFGQERQTRISERVSELTAEYRKKGEQFLLDELEKIGFPIVNGKAMAYTDEGGNPVMPSRARKEGYPDGN